MGVLTNLLKLLKPGENDYYNQQNEQADNWQKIDDYAVLTNTDKNGIWGGDFGGYIQDPIPKELNKRYIDNINGKAFICIKAGDSSVVSNTIEYFTPCNVVDNLDKLQNLVYSEPLSGLTITKNNRTVVITYDGPTSNLLSFIFPKEFRPYKEIKFYVFRGVYPASANTPVSCMQLSIGDNGAIKISRNVNNGSGGDVSNHIDSLYVSYISQD